MELLGDVGLDRVETQRGWFDPREGQEVVSGHDLGLAQHRVSEGHVDPECLTVEHPSQSALCSEPLTLVLDARSGDVRMARMRSDLEGHEVAEIDPASLLEPVEQPFRRAGYSQVDVAGGPRSLEPHLENETALQRSAVTEDSIQPCQVAVEDEELASSRDSNTRLRDVAQPLVERRLERIR